VHPVAGLPSRISWRDLQELCQEGEVQGAGCGASPTRGGGVNGWACSGKARLTR
jgi:hypothetical protein